ncbi:sel1 repeat family protein [Neptunicella sp.]|uniref:sel1 repeat family protein n=1 Tax=Neptunicella sp. TaxID=2125986 RepID=UPI003F68BCAB
MAHLWLLLTLFFVTGLQYDSSREPRILLHNAQQQPERYTSWALLLPVGTQQQTRLALSALSQSNSVYWLTIAAKANDANAQYLLAQLQTDPDASQFWLVEAANNGLSIAQQALYQQLHQSDPQQALAWLTKAAQSNADSALLLAEQKWQQGDQPQFKFYLLQAKRLGSVKADAYLNAFQQRNVMYSQTTNSNHCQQDIMLIATSLDSLLQAHKFKQKYHQDSHFNALPICLGKIKMFTNKQLDCADNWLGTQRLGCDENQLAVRLQGERFSHLVIFARQGKANVKNGIMYLDRQDSYQVFIHELAHFAGFVDEYPLSRHLAKQFCAMGKTIPNLLIEKNSQPLTLPKRWGDMDKSQLALARTCDNSEYQAYKPIEDFTFMEFYDQGVIPPLYLTLWQQQLAEPSQMLPAYINLANAAQSNGDKALQQYWWQRYQDFSNNLL